MQKHSVITIALFTATAVLPGATGYHVATRYPVPGNGGFDYVSIDPAARRLYLAHATEVAVVDPDVVVLGGVMAEAADLLLEPARMEAARRMPASVAGAVRITPGSLGDEAGALGAARAAMLAR